MISGSVEGSYRKIAIGGAFVTGVAQFVRLAVQSLSIIILARLLTPADFGLTAMVFPIIIFATMLQEAGLGAALIQRQSVSDEELATLFWFNALIGAAMAAILVAMAPLVAAFYGEPRVAGLTAASGGLVLFAALGAQSTAMMTRDMRFGRMAAVETVALVAGFVVALLVAWIEASYWAIWLMSFVTVAIRSVLGWALSGRLPIRCAPIRRVADMLAFGGHVTISGLFNYFGRNLDNVLIGRVWGGEMLGLYDRAYKLLMLPLLVVNAPLQRLLVPMLVRTRDDPGRYRHIYLSTLQTILLGTVPPMTLLAAAPLPAVRVLLGPAWDEAAPIFAWLGIAALVQLVTNSFGWLYISQGRSRNMMMAGVASSLWACLSFLIGLPWGALGVAIAYAVAELIRTPVMTWWVTRIGPVRRHDMMRATLPFLLAAIASFAAITLLARAAIWPPLALLAAGAPLAYAVTLATLMTMPAGRASIVRAIELIRSAGTLAIRRTAPSIS